MNHFKPREFHGWYDQLDQSLKVNLDDLREAWGRPIHISPAGAVAVGRHLGEANMSQHNVDRWGEVRAVDIMPEGIHTREDARRFRQLAEDCGFTGIGFYPHWAPRPGFHVDVRVNVNEHYVASWGRLKVPKKNPRDKGYVDVGIETAISELPATS